MIYCVYFHKKLHVNIMVMEAHPQPCLFFTNCHYNLIPFLPNNSEYEWYFKNKKYLILHNGCSLTDTKLVLNIMCCKMSNVKLHQATNMQVKGMKLNDLASLYNVWRWLVSSKKRWVLHGWAWVALTSTTGSINRHRGDKDSSTMLEQLRYNEYNNLRRRSHHWLVTHFLATCPWPLM